MRTPSTTGLLIGLSLVLSSQGFAQTLPEDALDATLDFEMPLDDSTDAADETRTSEESLEDNLFGKDLRFGFSYQLGTRADDLTDVTSHRVDTRLRWEKLLTENLFWSLDGKVIVRAPGDQQLEENEKLKTELRFREASLQSSFKSVSIKAGYQTTIWGEMDSARITDVMTPWDYSEFAFTTPEDARVGQPSIVFDWFVEQTRLNIIYTPQPFSNRYPGGSAAGLLEFMLDSNEFKVEENNPQLGKDYELGIRLKHTMGPSDVAFYVARFISDDPLFEFTGFESGVEHFDTRYPQHELIGLSANYGSGNFLWKMESAFKNNLYFPSQTLIIRDTAEAALGLDYNANGAYNLSIEMMHQYILPGSGTLLGVKTHNSQVLGRWSKKYLHETLSAVLFGSYQLQYRDITLSGALQYSLNDNTRIDLNATVFIVENQDSPYRFIDDWDMISAKISWDF